MDRGRARGRGRGRGLSNNSRPPRGGRGASIPQVSSSQPSHVDQTSRGRDNSNRGAHKNTRDIDFVNLPTISRSGDASGTGHELKDRKVQERYWRVIEDRLTRHFTKFVPNASLETSDEIITRQMKESEDIILIHLRRIREGVSSAQRLDELALKVYDVSLSFAVLCKSMTQIAAALSHFPSAHMSYAKQQGSNEQEQTHSRFSAMAILSLVFHLTESFPSQISYYHHLDSIPELCLPRKSEGYTWVSALRRAVHTRNYRQCDKLTRRHAIVTLCEELGLGADLNATDDIHRRALLSIVDALQSKVRESSWAVLRLSYREFRLGEDTDTAAWLSSMLLLRGPDTKDLHTADEWLKEKLTQGHVVEAEASNGRWVIRRQ